MLTKAITYADLNATFRKGLRNGNWRKLRFIDKALYRASLRYAKHRCIINEMLVEKLWGLIEKLKETKGKGMRIFRRGYAKAVAMLDRGEEKGVFIWAPRLKDWLKDPDYIFWLGTNLFFQTLGKFNQNASREEKLYQKNIFWLFGNSRGTYLPAKSSK